MAPSSSSSGRPMMSNCSASPCTTMQAMQEELMYQQLVSTYMSAMKVCESISSGGSGSLSSSLPAPMQMVVMSAGEGATTSSAPGAMPNMMMTTPGSDGPVAMNHMMPMGSGSSPSPSSNGGWYVISLSSARAESDFDHFFSKLEERFEAVDVRNEFKIPIASRLLTGHFLRMWTELSKCPENKTYENVRDAMIRKLYPNSTLYEQMLKNFMAVAEKPPAAPVPPPQITTSEGGVVEAPPAPQLSPEEEAASRAARAARGRAGIGASSLSMVRSKTAQAQESMSRVCNRSAKPLPVEELWVQWATNLMRPSLVEALHAMDTVPKTLQELFACLSDSPAAVAEEQRSIRRRKNRTPNPKSSRTGGGAGTKNGRSKNGSRSGMGGAAPNVDTAPNSASPNSSSNGQHRTTADSTAPPANTTVPSQMAPSAAKPPLNTTPITTTVA